MERKLEAADREEIVGEFAAAVEAGGAKAVLSEIRKKFYAKFCPQKYTQAQISAVCSQVIIQKNRLLNLSKSDGPVPTTEPNNALEDVGADPSPAADEAILETSPVRVSPPTDAADEEAEVESLLWNRSELIERTKILMEARITRGLLRILPKPIRATPEAQRVFDAFTIQIRTAMQQWHDLISQSFTSGSLTTQLIAEEVVAGYRQAYATLSRWASAQDLGMCQQIGTAIAEGINSLAADLDVSSLSEIRLLELMGEIPNHASIAASSFIDTTEEPLEIQIDFVNAENTNISKLAATGNESIAVDKFRFTWSDDELFIEEPLMAQRVLTNNRAELRRYWRETAETLVGGFREWKQQCRAKLGNISFLNEDGISMKLENALWMMEATFDQQVKDRGVFILKSFDIANPAGDGLTLVENGIAGNLETFCQLEGAPQPRFIREALAGFFQKARQSTPLEFPPFIGPRHISIQRVMYHFSGPEGLSQTKDALVKEILHGDGRPELVESAFAYMKQRIGKHPKKGALLDEANAAINKLVIDIETYFNLNLPDECIFDSASGFVRILKEAANDCARLIGRFHHVGLPPELNTQLQNFVGKWLARNLRALALEMPLATTMAIDDVYHSELETFFPREVECSPEQITQQSIPAQRIKKWWDLVVQEAEQRLVVKVSGASPGEAEAMQSAIKLQCLARTKAAVSALIPQADRPFTRGHLIDLLSMLRKESTNIPAHVEQDGNPYVVPMALTEFIQEQVGLLEADLVDFLPDTEKRRIRAIRADARRKLRATVESTNSGADALPKGGAWLNYNTDVKEKWRCAEMESVDRCLPLLKKRPEQLNVLCLPGIDCNLQIRHLLKRGIRPERIIAVERDFQAWPQFEKNCHAAGIKPRFGELREVLQDMDTEFDLVLLDLVEQYGISTQEIFYHLRTSKRAVVSVNLQAKMETDDSKRSMQGVIDSENGILSSLIQAKFVELYRASEKEIDRSMLSGRERRELFLQLWNRACGIAAEELGSREIEISDELRDAEAWMLMQEIGIARTDNSAFPELIDNFPEIVTTEELNKVRKIPFGSNFRRVKNLNIGMNMFTKGLFAPFQLAVTGNPETRELGQKMCVLPVLAKSALLGFKNIKELQKIRYNSPTGAPFITTTAVVEGAQEDYRELSESVRFTVMCAKESLKDYVAKQKRELHFGIADEKFIFKAPNPEEETDRILSIPTVRLLQDLQKYAALEAHYPLSQLEAALRIPHRKL